MTVLPVRSTRVAPAGTNTSARRPAAMKRVPSTTNAAFSMTLPSPVISRAPSYTVTGGWAFPLALPANSGAAAKTSRLVCIIEASLGLTIVVVDLCTQPLRYPRTRWSPSPTCEREQTEFVAPSPIHTIDVSLRPQRAAHALGRERQLAKPHAGQRGDGVADRAGDERQPILAGASRRIVGRDDLHLDVGHVRHAGDLIVRVVRLQHATILDDDLLAQHVAEAVDDRALGLRRDIARLYSNPSVDRAPHVVHLDLAARAVDRHFGDTGRQRVVLDHGA